MILRAASDSESDDGLLSAAQGSVFDPPKVDSTSAQGSATRYTWFAVCGALILLLLVDVAAIFHSSRDVFALLPLVVSSVFYQEIIILPPTASLLNQVVGLVFVAGWIYSREKSLASQGLCRGRYGPWTVMALMCLGHVVSCVYLLFAMLESNGDRSKFWLGRKRSKTYQTGPNGRV